jgi:hypothetical protein
MDNQPDFIVRRALARVVRITRHVSAAITLGLGLGAASVTHAGVPLPVIAETAGMPSLAAVVKRIAPSVATVEGRGRVAAEPNPRRRQAGKGIGPVLGGGEEIRTFGSGTRAAGSSSPTVISSTMPTRSR